MELDFNRLEAETYRECCAEGRAKIKARLEKLDDLLTLGRDRGVYRHKGKRKATVKTVMGEVEYERAMRIRMCGDGAGSAVFLLDEAAGIGGAGAMSGLLCGLIAEPACAGPYREAARAVSAMTGQSVSHAAAWNVAQALGRRADARAREAAALAERGEGRGTAEAAVLFVEKDGVWPHLQGEARKEGGKSKEMKAGIACDGAEKEGKDRWRLTGKVAAASFEPAAEFGRRMEGAIAEIYNTDETRPRAANGDGAAWIKQGAEGEAAIYQLDPYHRNRAAAENVSDPGARGEVFRLPRSGDAGRLLERIDALAGSAGDEAEGKKLRALREYFGGNSGGLAGWKRRGLEVPEPPEGKECRNLGAMESNIFTIIGNRMKGGRARWSVSGANNLAGLLALRHTGRLQGALAGLASRALPQKYSVDAEAAPARGPDHEGAGREPRRGGAAPATPEYKFLRDIARGGGVFGQG
jgi:hypothetical protein